VNLETNIQAPKTEPNKLNPKNITRLKILGVLFTLLGIGLFAYFIYSVGVAEILSGIGKIGFGGFALIIFLYFLRILMRAAAWKLSVYEPYKLDLRDTLPAVIIGEAMSSMIPLGILVSGTTKAVAVRKRVPLVVGLSSIATENLFYSFATALFIVFGAFAFLRTVELADGWIVTIDALIAVTVFLIFLGILMIVRQWHFASAICDWLYDKNVGKKTLENGRLHVRLFENFIYGFYRRYPRRFLPIFLLQIVYHLIGIAEVWFVLSKISDVMPSVFSAFLLESVSRLITIVFKLVPFVIGVDEAGAQFVGEALAMGVGVGVTLAIIRKGRILFWTAIGLIFIVKRGLSFREITEIRREA
jgi:hypothetical protein